MARSWLSLILWTLLAFLLLLGNQFVERLIPLPPPQSGALHLLGVAYLAVLLFALMRTARAATRLRQSASMLLLLGMALSLPFLASLALTRQHQPIPAWLMLTSNSFFLPVAAALAGTALGRLVNHPNTLLVGAGFAAFFDVVVVTMGPVALFLKKSPQTVSQVSLNGTGPHMEHGHLLNKITDVTIGPADILFLSLFLSAVAHLKLSTRATFIWIYALLMAALILVETVALPVPAWVPMGIAVLIANFRHARFTREEKYALIYGGGFALVLAAVMIVGTRHLLAAK